MSYVPQYNWHVETCFEITSRHPYNKGKDKKHWRVYENVILVGIYIILWHRHALGITIDGKILKHWNCLVLKCLLLKCKYLKNI